MGRNKCILFNQQVEKDSVTGGNLNQQVEISSATSGKLYINKWIGKAHFI